MLGYYQLSWDWTMVVYFIITFICIHGCVYGKIKKWLCEMKTRMKGPKENKMERKEK